MAGVSSLDDWPKVQLIATEEAPEEILSKFDFTVCQVCLVDNKGFASPEFFNDETNRRIRLNFVWPLIGADLLFCRVYKYVIKGYTLDLSTAMTLYNRMINATPEENNTWGGDPVSAEMINSWFTGLNSTTPGAGMSPEDWKKFSTLTGLIAAADKM
jgi:hypothetical protein